LVDLGGYVDLGRVGANDGFAASVASLFSGRFKMRRLYGDTLLPMSLVAARAISTTHPLFRACSLWSTWATAFFSSTVSMFMFRSIGSKQGCHGAGHSVGYYVILSSSRSKDSFSRLVVAQRVSCFVSAKMLVFVTSMPAAIKLPTLLGMNTYNFLPS
jgi:hypothetical protein